MLDVYLERFEHPYLLALVPVAILLFSLSIVAELLGNHVAAGFLVLYGINAVFFLLFGYGFFAALKLTTQGLRRYRVGEPGSE